MHLFDPFLDHDYYFKLLLIRRSRTPNQLLDVRLHTMAISALSCVRTELFHLLVVPSLAHHPEQANRQSSGHGDFDWRDETFAVQRSKRGGIQHYPIQYEVGEAILQYLRSGRPRCSCRHVFVTLCPPYRPLQSTSLWQIVSRCIKELGIASRHKGPHALRHACATHLLNKGTSLKEIADFLGHRDSRSIGIYAKYDTRSLRKVAAFRLAGLQ